MRAPPFQLAADTISKDTVECLEQLLAAARKGQVIGLAFVAMMKRRSYVVNTAGEAHRNPTFARGMVSSLDDELSIRVKGQMQ
jgi:hypothetical protein